MPITSLGRYLLPTCVVVALLGGRAVIAAAPAEASSASHRAAKAPFRRPAGAANPEEVAVGYQALFTCAAHFFAGRPLEDILRVELVDIAARKLPPPEIDDRRRLVRSRDGRGQTMVAAFREDMGCTLLPPHWSEADVGRLPSVEIPDPPDVSSLAFPRGDAVGPLKLVPAQRALLDRAFDGQSFGTGTVTASILVLKGSKLVAERYRRGFGVHSGYRTWSTAKSISAALVGIAVKDGLLQVEAPAPIPEWAYFDDPRQAITLAHLLQMSSGLYSQGSNTNAIYFGGQDVFSAATTTPLEAPPGQRWKYANNDTLLALRALRAALQDDLSYLRFPYDRLFAKIGMYHTRMEVDHLGNFIGSSQVYTTARDLARFGVLHLQEGVWEGERILPEGWTKFVATSAPARPRKAGERGYGAQFWLLDTMEGIPPGTYTTAGNKGQYVTIIPARDLVVVRTGVDPNGTRWKADRFVAEAVKVFP
ncbi:MAG: serine hydrolase [Myxococcota bacterium]